MTLVRLLTAGLFAALALAGAALAAPTQSQMGYLSTSACGTGPVPCFVQYGDTLPVSASVSFPTIGQPVPSTGIYMAGNKSGTLTGALLDSDGFLQVNCSAGCAGGTFN